MKQAHWRRLVAISAIAMFAAVGTTAILVHRAWRAPLPSDLKLTHPRIVVEKSARRLLVYDETGLKRVYHIGLGPHPLGDKEIEGDGRTPEGDYYIYIKNPNSSYFRSLGVSYPNASAAERGLAAGLISQAEHDAIVETNRLHQAPPQKTALGGLIYIHGNGSGRDWTLGCIALDDGDMLELFESIPSGTPISIER